MSLTVVLMGFTECYLGFQKLLSITFILANQLSLLYGRKTIQGTYYFLRCVVRKIRHIRYGEIDNLIQMR